MNIAAICISAVMVSAPAENYYAEISPEISAEIITCIINGEYRQHIDYNGDGNLTIADAVCVEKRYQNNCICGNSLEFTGDDVREIIAENYAEYPIEWEICSVNDDPCCCYDITVSEITDINILFEWENQSEVIEVELNPYTEIYKVLS
jgi:hypothetical protein